MSSIIEGMLAESEINPLVKLVKLAERSCACPGKVSEKTGLCVACDARRELRWIEGRAVDILRHLRMWHLKPVGEEKPVLPEEEKFKERLQPPRHFPESTASGKTSSRKRKKDLDLRV